MFSDGQDSDAGNNSAPFDSVDGDGRTHLYADFIEAFGTGGELSIHGEEGKKAMDIILRAYEESL